MEKKLWSRGCKNYTLNILDSFDRDYVAQIQPSGYEGMANVDFGSAASGRCNIHGCLEVAEDGINGCLAERKNADDLCRAMKRYDKFSYEKREAMGVAGRKHLEDIFDKKKYS